MGGDRGGKVHEVMCEVSRSSDTIAISMAPMQANGGYGKGGV